MKMIDCPKCGDEMPELRKTQYGYNFCVNCSTIGAKRGMPVQYGHGDHTYTETIIMDGNDYDKFIESDKPLPRSK